MNRVEYIVDRTRGPRVLDFGCVQHGADMAGSEMWVHGRLAGNFEHVVGVDILEREVERINDLGYTAIAADVTELDVNLTANTVVMGEIIEHVDNPGQMLERAREHLKPDGQVVLSTPNPWGIVNLRRIADGGFPETVNDEHVAWYGPTVLEQLFDRHGFRVDEIVSATGEGHGGLHRVAQWLTDNPYLTGTTWCLTATLTEETWD